MSDVTSPLEQESSYIPSAERTAGGEDRHDAHVRHIIERILWMLGVCLLAAAALYIHAHKGPLPGEVAFSRAVQAIHYAPAILAFLTFFSSLNDIPPSIAEVIIVALIFLLMRWFKQVAFFLLTLGVGNGTNMLIGDYVQRPRPGAKLIHVYTPLNFNSFPSGHTEHDVVFYGSLLYLSFTRAVREWRYHWILIPFQIFAGLAIFCIGYSRVLEGEHWLSDVLGGYLSGALWLFLLIFCYRWVTTKLQQRKTQKA
ncbi:phosphatase PAP2 family protein [Dictyobacter arantiisoli]|uniref:Phosphatase PAP2 family protein n=1 Tax=Dictyobacter arantiisoli TaxID=2014874 RepID=A0A5A5T6R7_9CHLR|nr:phosphatase PAP2 family protein [Dictyobacter arantiisoli]GCF06935.1 phosphatase PAP2 family protein [Dictyobacter arantiisoli]